MAVSAMSISEGPYTDLTFPDRHVYATLDKTPPPNSSGVRSTEQSSPPHRQAAVALGILCAILLTATITLSVLYTRQRVLQKPSSLNCTCINLQKDRLNKENISAENILAQLYELYGISSSCPEGWNLFSSKCYFFSTEKRAWDNSRRYCKNRGADLVIVNNQDEQEFINKHAIRGHYWIGLWDRLNRTFVWVDGTPLQKAFWKAGSPDQNRGTLRHAVLTGPGEELWVDTLRTHTWMWICESNALEFACQNRDGGN